MNFFKFLNFPLKSTEIPNGLRFQLASVTINFTDNRDYRAVLYSMLGIRRIAISAVSLRGEHCAPTVDASVRGELAPPATRRRRRNVRPMRRVSSSSRK